jgi:hypothetical protein
LSEILYREDICKEHVQFEGVVHWMTNARDKRQAWREVTFVILIESEIIRFAWFPVDVRKGEEPVSNSSKMG